MMTQRLLSAFLLVWIDHGADEDWGPHSTKLIFQSGVTSSPAGRGVERVAVGMQWIGQEGR